MTLRHYNHTHRPAPEPVKRQRILAYVVGGACLIVGTIAIARGVQGAERTTPGPHEITLLFNGADLEKVSRSFFTLSGPYADKQGCEKAKIGLVVMVKGARLRCDPVNPFRVN